MAKKKISDKLRLFIRERACGCCEYCLSQDSFSTEKFPVDHIVPLKKGGSNEVKNLAQACHGCNWHKADRTEAEDPVTKLMTPLFNPRQQKWSEHFAWNKDLTHVIGLTPIGRATVEALQLNRENLLSYREAIYVLGEHPPRHSSEK